jgi:hypothetical protein
MSRPVMALPRPSRSILSKQGSKTLKRRTQSRGGRRAEMTWGASRAFDPRAPRGTILGVLRGSALQSCLLVLDRSRFSDRWHRERGGLISIGREVNSCIVSLGPDPVTVTHSGSGHAFAVSHWLGFTWTGFLPAAVCPSTCARDIDVRPNPGRIRKARNPTRRNRRGSRSTRR